MASNLLKILSLVIANPLWSYANLFQLTFPLYTYALNIEKKFIWDDTEDLSSNTLKVLYSSNVAVKKISYPQSSMSSMKEQILLGRGLKS